jgi:hypothetical protein
MSTGAVAINMVVRKHLIMYERVANGCSPSAIAIVENEFSQTWRAKIFMILNGGTLLCLLPLLCPAHRAGRSRPYPLVATSIGESNLLEDTVTAIGHRYGDYRRCRGEHDCQGQA